MVNIHATRDDITHVEHPTAGRIDVDPDLHTINVPADLASELLTIRTPDGEPLWETSTQFEQRRAAAELNRRRDPAEQSLLLSKLVELQTKQLAGQLGVNIDDLAKDLKPETPAVPEHKIPEADPAAEAAKLSDLIVAKDYDAMGRNDLSKLAGDRGLNGGGTKADLIARLREQDRRA